jgi:acyl-CoA synthetase (AMP-forming)/AMP-acid ligase II
MDQRDQSAMDEYDPPLLQMINNYGHSGLQKGIVGTEIQQLLSGKYSNLLELFPNSDDAAIIDPSSERLDLTHSVLKSFLQNDLDLLRYGITYQSRIGVLIPNGPELATILVSLVTKWCAAPINPNITAAEVKIELESMKCSAVILLSGFTNNSAIVQVASELGLPVLSLHPSVAVSGLFSLELMSTSTPLQVNSRPQLTQSLVTNSGYNTNEMTVLLLHTSGTGGKKKLVPYTLEMLVIGVACIISSWNLSPDDRCLNMMPLFHIGGIVRNIFSPLLSGGSVICCNAFDPVLFWDILIARRFTWYYAAPTMHHAILLEASQRVTASQSSNQFNLKHIVKPVRFIANAAGGLLPALAESLKKVFQTTILTSYGMTEWFSLSPLLSPLLVLPSLSALLLPLPLRPHLSSLPSSPLSP